MNQFHASVLLKEAVDCLEVREDQKYIDATAGGGGHTFEILAQGGKVLAIDRDPDAIAHIKKKVKSHKLKVISVKDLVLVQANFNKIGEIAKANGFDKVDGILFDLGASSHQLEEAQRGFSFQREGPLDMRMDPNLKVTATDIINNFDKRRLNEIFEIFGQEKLSRPISDAIVSTRKVKQIQTTRRLADIVNGVYRQRGARGKINPATRVFMALRIVVNSELLNLKETLPQTVDLLNKNGRLVVITFHSLEDGIVKRFFKQDKSLEVLFKKPIGPSRRQIGINPRSRSAKLRVAQKI